MFQLSSLFVLYVIESIKTHHNQVLLCEACHLVQYYVLLVIIMLLSELNPKKAFGLLRAE